MRIPGRINRGGDDGDKTAAVCKCQGSPVLSVWGKTQQRWLPVLSVREGGSGGTWSVVSSVTSGASATFLLVCSAQRTQTSLERVCVCVCVSCVVCVCARTHAYASARLVHDVFWIRAGHWDLLWNKEIFIRFGMMQWRARTAPRSPTSSVYLWSQFSVLARVSSCVASLGPWTLATTEPDAARNDFCREATSDASSVTDACR